MEDLSERTEFERVRNQDGRNPIAAGTCMSIFGALAHVVQDVVLWTVVKLVVAAEFHVREAGSKFGWFESRQSQVWVEENLASLFHS